MFLQVGLDRVTSQTYRNLLAKLPQGPVVVSAAYEAIEKKIKQVSYFILRSLSKLLERISLNKLESSF